MLVINIQFFGGRGSDGGKRSGKGGGGAAEGKPDRYAQMEQKYGKEYADNERRAAALEKELNAEMSSPKARHSVNWREDMRSEIDKLRKRNQEIAYG